MFLMLIVAGQEGREGKKDAANIKRTANQCARFDTLNYKIDSMNVKLGNVLILLNKKYRVRK